MDIYRNDEERQMIVGLALMVADGDRAAGPNTARILAHEVRTLRKELAEATVANELLREDKLKRDDLVEQVRSMQVQLLALKGGV